MVALVASGLAVAPKDPMYWVWRAVVFLACGVVLYFLVRPRARGADTTTGIHLLPAEVTPLAVLNLLRLIEQDERLSLSPEERLELAQSIRDLEQGLFGPCAEPGGRAEAHLEQLARRWLSRIP